MPMSDEERQALARKLDEDLDNFIKEAEAKSAPREKADLNKILEEMETHPAFMKELDLSKPLHPLVAGLQALKYESDSPEDNAESYKEEGNRCFKRKTYRFAIDNYTKGIQEKPANRLLNAQLYTNRAASHFHIGNFRSSFIDCVVARKFVPDHVKAIVRGIHCCLELKRAEHALGWCDQGLTLAPTDTKLLELRANADKLKRQLERDRRKELAKERQEAVEERNLVAAIKERGVQLANVSPDVTGDPLILTAVETHHPSGAKVHLDQGGALNWPVLFLYPEYAQTDSIKAFNEHSTLADHIQVMFGDDPPPWDEQGNYRPADILVYFENTEHQTLHQVDLTATLGTILKKKKYVVAAGTPNFILLSKKSKYTEVFLSKYKR